MSYSTTFTPPLGSDPFVPFVPWRGHRPRPTRSRGAATPRREGASGTVGAALRLVETRRLRTTAHLRLWRGVSLNRGLRRLRPARDIAKNETQGRISCLISAGAVVSGEATALPRKRGSVDSWTVGVEKPKQGPRQLRKRHPRQNAKARVAAVRQPVIRGTSPTYAF